MTCHDARHLSLPEEFPSFFRVTQFVPGWEPLLRSLCKQLAAIEQATGIATYAEDLKEKLGSLRITHQVVTADSRTTDADIATWMGIIDALVERTESESEKIEP